MTRKEQARFVRELTRNITKQVVTTIQQGRVPEEWDGHELRVLLADRFNESASMSLLRKDGRARRSRAYRNAVMIGNLL